MTRNKDDFLKECMSDPALVSTQVKIDEFNRQYCLVCANRDCARSTSNNMSFDRRVANWESTLFTNVPRADSNDPRLIQIRQKIFAPVMESTEIRGNMGFVPVMQPQPQPVPQPIIEPPAPTRFEPVQNPVPVPEPARSAEPPAPPPPPLPTVHDGNTPFTQGAILPGGKPAEPVEEVIMIEPGGSFTFGD